MHEADINPILSALRSPKYELRSELPRLPSAPGLYAIYGDHLTWKSIGIGEPVDDLPLYVGKAEDSLVRREHQHPLRKWPNRKLNCPAIIRRASATGARSDGHSAEPIEARSLLQLRTVTCRRCEAHPVDARAAPDRSLAKRLNPTAGNDRATGLDAAESTTQHRWGQPPLEGLRPTTAQGHGGPGTELAAIELKVNAMSNGVGK